MLKWILIAIAVLVIGGCSAIVGGIYWAYSSVQATPEFYEEVEPVELTPEARSRKLVEVRELARTVVPHVEFPDEPSEEASAENENEADPTEPINVDERAGKTEAEESTGSPRASSATRESAMPVERKAVPLKLDEATLNSYIAALYQENAGDRDPLSDPRVQLNDDLARIGIRLNTPEYRGVVSVDVKPTVLGPKSLAVEFHRIALGNLGIPLERALASAKINVSDLPKGIAIPKNAKPPRIEFSWDHLDEVPTEISSIEIREGMLLLEFAVPETKSLE